MEKVSVEVPNKEVRSYRTAISRSGPSSPVRLIGQMVDLNGKILDYGCGKGTDVLFLLEKGHDIEGYDPHYFDIDLSKRSSYYDVILCTYVLNVITEDEEKLVITDILDKLKPGGKAYLTVRRDSFKKGETSRGYQRLVFLDGYPSIKKSGAFETYILSKEV